GELGVPMAYARRVGNGPFPSETPGDEAGRRREAGEGHGATTGRPGRCGWLDLPALRYGARVNGLDELVVTKLDVLDDFEEIRVVVAYEGAERSGCSFPLGAAALGRVTPAWRRFTGWRTPTVGVCRWSALPAAA